MHIRDGLINWR